MRLSIIGAFLLVSVVLVDAKNKCKPQQIHLALSDEYTTDPSINSPIKAIFHTEDACDTAYIVLDTPQGAQNIYATAVNYFTAEYSDGDYDTYVHIFDFPHLEYEQVYQYTCYSDNPNTQKAQGPFTFYVPNPQPTAKITTVIMFGDLDSSNDGQTTLDQLISLKDTNFTSIAAYIHMGDISYDLESKAGKNGDDYMNAVQDFAASMPYMISPGNHETLQNFSNVNMRFKMPYFSQTQNHYYSYNLGNMHFTSINLDLVILYPDLMQTMIDWLNKDLAEAAANREERPWIIMYTHRPLYCSKDNDDCNNNSIIFQEIEDVINNYEVDLYVSGHVHAYERMLPIYRNKTAQFDTRPDDNEYRYIINPKAPIYVVQGMSGHDGDDDHGKLYPTKEFTVTLDTEYSFVAVHSIDSNQLLVENYHSKNGKVSDYFYLIKGDQEQKVEPIKEVEIKIFIHSKNLTTDIKIDYY